MVTEAEVVRMARAWVVYESMFARTRQVAEAIAEGVADSVEVEVREVSRTAPLPRDLDLLVVGGPTHAFGLGDDSSREDAARKAQRTAPESFWVRAAQGPLVDGELDRAKEWGRRLAGW